jgi:hypothetical protein
MTTGIELAGGDYSVLDPALVERALEQLNRRHGADLQDELTRTLAFGCEWV